MKTTKPDSPELISYDAARKNWALYCDVSTIEISGKRYASRDEVETFPTWEEIRAVWPECTLKDLRIGTWASRMPKKKLIACVPQLRLWDEQDSILESFGLPRYAAAPRRWLGRATSEDEIVAALAANPKTLLGLIDEETARFALTCLKYPTLAAVIIAERL